MYDRLESTNSNSHPCIHSTKASLDLTLPSLYIAVGTDYLLRFIKQCSYVTNTYTYNILIYKPYRLKSTIGTVPKVCIDYFTIFILKVLYRLSVTINYSTRYPRVHRAYMHLNSIINSVPCSVYLSLV